MSINDWLSRIGMPARSRGRHQTPAPVDSGRATITSSQIRAAVAFAASLSFRNVAKRYGEYTALADISLDIAAGEVVCLLGPSGCGKTTLLRLASGIDRPTSGEVLLNERIVAGPDTFIEPEQRNVGLMFQDFALFPHLTILENVAFGLNALDKATAQREARAALTRVGLERYGKDYPHILSGGQQQRVALARALAPRPAIILMDEPFSGLDVQLRETIRNETLALLRETRSTCLLVTHDPDEAVQLADRIAVMRDGHVIQAGDAQTLYHDPADLFVARLFSKINELDVMVKDGEVDTPLGRFPATPHANGSQVTLCVRQRAIWVYPADHEGAYVRGRVLASRFLGDLALLDVAVEGLNKPVASLVRADRAPDAGSDVNLMVDPAGTMVFGHQ